MTPPAPAPTPSPGSGASARREVDHLILALAVPSLGALIAEPLFLMVDSAFIARVGTTDLAGLGLASTVLATVVGLMVFLAYSTTAAVSRAVGAGRMREAIARGVDASWLALLIGAGAALLLAGLAPWIMVLFGPEPAVHAHATTYLRISAFGVPAMLAVQAATGLVRGLQNARLPLVIAATGAIVNIPLNALLIFGLGLGVAGSAIGTVIAQWGMAAAFLTVTVRAAGREAVSLRPQWGGVAGAWRDSVPMLVRTVALRVVVLLGTWAATGLGATELGAHQLATTVFMLLSLALDALAIAGQALTGKHLGAADAPAVHAVTGRLIQWGVGGGVVTGLVLLAASYVVPGAFTPDVAVQESLRAALWVLVVAQPVAGYVFVLDGVLMGAGDAPYLARASLVSALVTAGPAVWVGLSNLSGPVALAAVWATCTLLFLIARAVTLGWRVRGEAWMRLGAQA